MLDEVYARCLHPQTRQCREVQLVHRPDHHDGRMINRCRFCSGVLLEMSNEEMRALREARARLQEGGAP
jgi:hypothetical protein